MSWPTEIAEIAGVVVDEARPPSGDLGPWVGITEGGASGYLDLGALTLVDLSFDGQAEAVIPLSGGVDQPGRGVVVFTPTTEEPELVGDAAFYSSFGANTRPSVEGAELVLRHSVGTGWEPPCCPSGEVTRRFRSDHQKMIETTAPLEVGNLDARGFTIDRFYALVGQRNLDAAYLMLTDGERARTIASQWPAWWALGEQITVNMLDTTRTDGLVPFRLIIAARDGRVMAWQGGAGLTYSTAQHAWLIELISLQPESA